MSIQVNGNVGAVNWEALLGKIGEVTKTEGADGAAGTTNVTITTRVDGVETPVTIRIPDDLEIPAEVDQAAIDSLCEKLAADTGLNLTDEQLAQFHDVLSGTLKEVCDAAAAGDAKAGAAKNAMFDLYKLMALLVEVAQKQRDANREMRQAESEAIQNSIINQANAQRDAAVTGMIAGAICCVLQIGVTAIAGIKQTKAFNEQLGTDKTAGLDVARQNVDMMKAANNQANANTQLTKVQNQVGGKPSLVEGHTVRSEVENSFTNSAEFRQAQTKFTDTKNALQTATENRVTADAIGRNAATVTSQDVAGLDAPEFADLKTAVSRLDTARADFNNAKEQVTAELNGIQNLSEADKQFFLEKSSVPFDKLNMADKSRLMNIKTTHPETANIDTGTLSNAGAKFEQAKADVARASDGAFAKFAEKVGTHTFELETAKDNLRAQINLEMQKFEGSYDSALKDYNEATKSGTTAEIKAAEVKLEKAKNQLTYARAYGNVKLMQDGLTDPKAHLADVETARGKLLSAQQTRANSVDYIRASNSINNAQAFNGLIGALGGFAQGMIQNWTQLKQSAATLEGAEQQKKQEELDQTKDLFSQAQSLVDSVVQLLQAIGAAESQSMRDAIQA